MHQPSPHCCLARASTGPDSQPWRYVPHALRARDGLDGAMGNLLGGAFGGVQGPMKDILGGILGGIGGILGGGGIDGALGGLGKVIDGATGAAACNQMV